MSLFKLDISKLPRVSADVSRRRALAFARRGVSPSVLVGASIVCACSCPAMEYITAGVPKACVVLLIKTACYVHYKKYRDPPHPHPYQSGSQFSRDFLGSINIMFFLANIYTIFPLLGGSLLSPHISGFVGFPSVFALRASSTDPEHLFSCGFFFCFFFFFFWLLQLYTPHAPRPRNKANLCCTKLRWAAFAFAVN